MQVPRGQSSVLYELRDGNLTAAEAIDLSLPQPRKLMEFRSNVVDVNEVSVKDLLNPGMSPPYVHKTAASLNEKGWIETIDEDNASGNRYRLRHHLCDYEDMPVESRWQTPEVRSPPRCRRTP